MMWLWSSISPATHELRGSLHVVLEQNIVSNDTALDATRNDLNETHQRSVHWRPSIE